MRKSTGWETRQVAVKVTNTGVTQQKHAVQLCFPSYTNYDSCVEKSAIQLVSLEKQREAQEISLRGCSTSSVRRK